MKIIMKMNEKAIEAIIEGVVNMKIPNFNIIEAQLSSPYVIHEDEGTYEIDIKIILKEKVKKKPKEEAKRASEDMFNESDYGRVQIGEARNNR